MTTNDADGFSLVETVVAVGLLAGALSGLISLFTMSARANLTSRHASVATMLAVAKLEELSRVTPLAASPANAVDANTPGFCELLNEQGAVTGGCASAADRAPYIRRWSIEPIAGSVPATALRVLVTWNSDPSPSTWTGLRFDEVRLATLRVEGWR